MATCFLFSVWFNHVGTRLPENIDAVQSHERLLQSLHAYDRAIVDVSSAVATLSFAFIIMLGKPLYGLAKTYRMMYKSEPK